MDEATRARLGEQTEPGDRGPAPGPLRLVQQFLNTHNHEFPREADRLGTPEKAGHWLVGHGLLPMGTEIDEGDRRRLVQARDALRALAMANHGRRVDAIQLRVLNEAGATCVTIRFGLDGRPSLEPAADGVAGALGRILVAGYQAWLAGTWARLKGCAQCEWVFFDRSKNRSGRWCSMTICGNRTKNRAYRRRRSTAEHLVG